jgi:hypothetical protein
MLVRSLYGHKNKGMYVFVHTVVTSDKDRLYLQIIHFIFHQDVLHSFKEALYSVTNVQFRKQNGNKLEYDSKKQVMAYFAKKKKGNSKSTSPPPPVLHEL